MAYQKLQASSAIQVVTADAVNIPNPAAVAANGSTDADGRATNQLINSAATFLDGSVKRGDIIYASTGGTNDWTLAAIVLNIVSNTTLDIDSPSTGAGTLFNTGLTYRIFSQADNPQNGCCLYVGDVTGGTDLEILTAEGNDKIMFKGVNAGQFIPVNVLRVYRTNTTAASIVALW